MCGMGVVGVVELKVVEFGFLIVYRGIEIGGS